MYSRRFEEAPPNIPQNYAGIALDPKREEPKAEELSPRENAPPEKEAPLPQKSDGKMPDADLLLLLLAFILMGDPAAEELPTLLLLLLAFQPGSEQGRNQNSVS